MAASVLVAPARGVTGNKSASGERAGLRSAEKDKEFIRTNRLKGLTIAPPRVESVNPTWASAVWRSVNCQNPASENSFSTIAGVVFSSLPRNEAF